MLAPALRQHVLVHLRRRGVARSRQVDDVSTNIGYLSAMITAAKSIDRGCRFPAEVIEHAVWLDVRSSVGPAQ
jgi:hypothetical protein